MKYNLQLKKLKKNFKKKNQNKMSLKRKLII